MGFLAEESHECDCLQTPSIRQPGLCDCANLVILQAAMFNDKIVETSTFVE